MPEILYVEWSPTHWASEPGLRLCRPATRGIWFDALNTMMLTGTYHISGTHEELCGLLSCLPTELTLALQQLKARNVAEIAEQNGSITLTSRKRKRDHEISEARRRAGQASGIARSKPQGEVSASVAAIQNEKALKRIEEKIKFLKGQFPLTTKEEKTEWNNLRSERAALMEKLGFKA